MEKKTEPITQRIIPNGNCTEVVKVGVVIAGGSGRLLAHIIRDFLAFYIEKCNPSPKNKGIELYFDEELQEKNSEPTIRTYSSYDLLVARGNRVGVNMKKRSIEESKKLINLYEFWHKEGVGAVFRTSVNAEALYSFRQEVGAIKEILITQQQFVEDKRIEKKPIKVLMIRDQIQGFYTNDDYTLNNDEMPTKITFQGHFEKEKFRQIIEFAKQRGNKRLDEGFTIWLSYKFHLFGNIIGQWIKEIDPSIAVYQPDTGFTELFAYLRNKENDNREDLLFIAGNEIGDLMYEPLIEILKSTGRKLDLYSRSFMTKLKTESSYLYELQTVHGSADDKINKGKEDEILPYATLRVASVIIENELGVKGFMRLMDKAVAKVQLKSKLRKSIEGEFSCTQIIKEIEEEIKK